MQKNIVIMLLYMVNNLCTPHWPIRPLMLLRDYCC